MSTFFCCCCTLGCNLAIFIDGSSDICWVELFVVVCIVLLESKGFDNDVDAEEVPKLSVDW